MCEWVLTGWLREPAVSGYIPPLATEATVVGVNWPEKI